MISMFSNLNLFAEMSGTSLVSYFVESNLAGQVIVIILAVFSIAAWAVMLGKYNDLSDLRNSNVAVENMLARSASALGSAAEARSMRGTYAAVLREAVAAWNRFGSAESSAELLALRMQLVENAMQRSIARQCIRYESKMILLGSLVTGAPFLGLLGTVWGVMDSFGGMGQHAVMTLQALAPGVSGALLTTVAGLVVAIPSVFGYNFLLSMTKGMVTDLENFASSLADKIELEGRQKIITGNAAAAQHEALRAEVEKSLRQPAHAQEDLNAMGRVDFSDDVPPPPPASAPADSKFRISFDDDGDGRYQD